MNFRRICIIPRRWGNGERSRQTAQTIAHRGDTEYLAASIP